MNILINLVLFYLTLSNANSCDDNPGTCCTADSVQALRKLSKPIGEDPTSVGAVACGDLLDHYTELEEAPWCACFKWPEAVDLINGVFDDCKFSWSTHANFPVKQAVDWCNGVGGQDTPCTAVTAQSVCVAKNCLWDTDATPQCTGVNTDRQNYDTFVADSADALEVPWIDGCDMLVAVYDQYHNRTCDDVVYELKEKADDADALFPDVDDGVFTLTLRDVCGETCWYQDQGAPYVFDRNHHCTSHADCNGGNETVHDYFCADCASCMAPYVNVPANVTNNCGICRLTKYDTDVCIEMQQCTAEKSIDNQCASQTETLPQDVTTGNERCAAEDTYENIRIDACYNYYKSLHDDETIRLNACPCHLDPKFVDFDCAWDIQFLYTLKETKEQCAKPCDQIMDRDVCLSAHQNDDTNTACVWLNRLVKGKCSDDPCEDDVDFCAHDSCVRCSSNAMGEKSCIVIPEQEGSTCNDKNDETDNDVCGTELYDKEYEGTVKHFACKGVSAVEQLQQTKKLCTDLTAWDECCVNGEEYRCANKVLNYTRYTDGLCNVEVGDETDINSVMATYYWNMNETCSNVITTQARSGNIYFSGRCDLASDEAFITVCTEEEYWDYLESQTPSFIPFDDSASTLGILSIISLLLFFFI